MPTTVHRAPLAQKQPSHLNGFNQNACFDPFFAAPAPDEELVQFSSHTSPDPQLCSNASSPPSKIHSRSTSSPPQPQAQLQHQLDHQSVVNTLCAATSPSQSLDSGAPSTHNFLSPHAGLMSDNGYDLSDQSTTPGFGEDFNLDDFGFLTDPDQDVVLNQLPEHSGVQPPRDQHSHNNGLTPSRKSQQQSPGAATLSSHLMSPVLTDRASPGSRDGRGSPTMEQHNASVGGFNTGAEAYMKAEQCSAGSSHSQGQMLQTPTLTGSSIDTSPERPTAPAIARAASPIVRIESYSRGDSPNRPAQFLARSGSKRSRTSRASLHLAVEQDDESSEEAEEERHHSADTATAPEDPRTGRPRTSARSGLDPQARLQVSHTEVPNFKDAAENEQIALKIADVEDWLARSETGSDAGGTNAPPPKPAVTRRARARSTGDQSLTHANLMNLKVEPPTNADLRIPGPGVLLDEESGEEDWDMEDNDGMEGEESDCPDSPPAVITVESPTNKVSEFVREDVVASPPPMYRARVWQDPLYDSTDPGDGVKMQPVSSNDAIMRFQQRVNDLETLSRAATWGTRRLSESDLEGLFHRFSFKIDDDDDDGDSKEKGTRRGSFLEQAAAKLLPKRSQSMLKRKDNDGPKSPPHRLSVSEHKKTDSLTGRQDSLNVPIPQRRPSLGKRPKSPRINTGSAIASMANQIAAVGASGPVSATGNSSPTHPWASAKNVMKRSRSRSDLQGTSSSTNLTTLWTKQGGPPMPTLAAPPQTPPKEEKPQLGEIGDMDEDDEDEGVEDKGVTIDLSIRADPIIPTMEGFRSNARQLNPRLPPFLIERVAQEQLRRYKKLIDFKVKHAQALSARKCASGKHCIELGGEPTYLPSKANGKEPELSHSGFAVAGLGQSDDDANALAEGIVTPAQFPPGVPMPPVKRLPAEFECSLCFKVKKFHKPSDWSKHVHEDVQPFTCTFQSCAEPKSFKRKADWVRHENERHRQLEWWMCNMHDCSHKCYRKDNFVQHLVREHKLPEPKVKTTKAGKPAVRGPSSQKARANKDLSEDPLDEVDQVWRLVEECRHETPKNPKDEPCKFCGNICNSWKKLTVHLAKHMEQISMPVLNVVKLKEVTPETIISPIEQVRTSNSQNNSSVSPLGPSSHSQRQSSYEHSIHSSIPSYNGVGTSAPSMGGLPGSFTPLQSRADFYTNQPANHFQRIQNATYPPQVQSQTNSNFAQNRGAPYNMSSYNTYDSTTSGSQFVPVNVQTQRATMQYPQASSPETMYGNMRPSLPSQTRTASFGGQHPRHDAYPSYQPQSGDLTGSVEAPVYGYRGHGSPPGAPFAPQQQAVDASAAIGYGHLQTLGFSQASGDGNMYGPPQHQSQSYGF
ncbi:MAG: hypothetical protein LQ342_004890 [Letrouitia transgressa]|nr:MAG: hypothetical protein LQ342_004890 [Letrouitia transgressa]